MTFDVSMTPLHWILGHPVASQMLNVFNIVLPVAERWFVTTLYEALPLVQDADLADDIRGFIGQEATHADAHEYVLQEVMEAAGVDPTPLLKQADYVRKVTGTHRLHSSPDPSR